MDGDGGEFGPEQSNRVFCFLEYIACPSKYQMTDPLGGLDLKEISYESLCSRFAWADLGELDDMTL